MLPYYINGTNITPFLAQKGAKWKRNDVDGPNAGRVLENAFMERDRLATKIRYDFTCRPLYYNELILINQLIYPEYVTFYYKDPLFGWRTALFYSNNNTADVMMMFDDTENDLYDGITFPLVEA